MNLWFFLAMLGLVGCDFSSPETQTIVNSCASASDCSAGTCGDGICIDDSRASLEVAVEVLRGSSDPERVIPASWAFAAESVSSGTVRDLDAAAPAMRSADRRSFAAGRAPAPLAGAAPVATRAPQQREGGVGARDIHVQHQQAGLHRRERLGRGTQR